ncbi:hypothetical protein B0T16DRAFT_197005 [Cercophora newfieldiana]|uniref:Uncharacterized protein n=1 Tax=Cercophora newfieldiana TaxID=92897 RepID=A0AA39Y411_9PEZI|nr:hypothetical protein B0T16DRAFT_197005 [Cercophora newfieldiana]
MGIALEGGLHFHRRLGALIFFIVLESSSRHCVSSKLPRFSSRPRPLFYLGVILRRVSHSHSFISLCLYLAHIPVPTS